MYRTKTSSIRVFENWFKKTKQVYIWDCNGRTTRDESSHISSNGQRVLPSGGISADGPPTTLSGMGIDRMVFGQANITRDNTKFVNGAIVGERNVFQAWELAASSLFSTVSN